MDFIQRGIGLSRDGRGGALMFAQVVFVQVVSLVLVKERASGR